MPEENNKKVMSAKEFLAQQNGTNNANEVNNNKKNAEQYQTNMSGKGSSYPAPDAVAKRFNWGAFIWTWIWGLGNNTYITLIIFGTILVGWIPIIGWLISLGLCIWFGIKGNEWAWQNKHFDSVNAFHDYQKKWAIAGVVVYCILISLAIIGIIVSLTLPTALNNTSVQQNNLGRIKASAALAKVVALNQQDEKQCVFSSDGLAQCFEEYFNGNREGNVINAYDGSIWTFLGDGKCQENGNCKVTIEVDNGRVSDVADIHLYSENGLVKFDMDDVENYRQ